MYQKYSSSEKQFIQSSIRNNLRIDGRQNLDTQLFTLKINNLEHLLGSSFVSIENCQNSVYIYTGIKIKVEKQSNSKFTKNLKNNKQKIRESISLQIGCIKNLTQSEELVRVCIQNYLNKYVIEEFLNEFQSLLTIPHSAKHYLTMNIQTYILTVPHLSYIEYLHISIKNAIQNLKIPSFTVLLNQITNEEIIDINSQENTETQVKPGQSISLYKGLAHLKIVGVIDQTYVNGMTPSEYEAVECCLLIAFGEQNKIKSFQSLKGAIKVQELNQIIKFARS